MRWRAQAGRADTCADQRIEATQFTSDCRDERTARPGTPLTMPTAERQEERDTDQRAQEQSVGQGIDNQPYRQPGQHREDPRWPNDFGG